MAEQEVRTYGGWRRSRGMGLFGLGPMQTLIVLGTITLLIISGSVSVTVMAVLAGSCRAQATATSGARVGS